MLITLNMIDDLISEFSPHYLYERGEAHTPCFAGIRLLSFAGKPDENYVYFCSESLMKKPTLLAASNLYIFCCTPSDGQVLRELAAKNHVCALQPGTDIADVWNRIVDSLARLNDVAIRFEAALEAKNSPQEIIHIIEDIFPNPLVYFDRIFNVVAHTSSIDESNALLGPTIKNRALPEQHFEKIRHPAFLRQNMGPEGFFHLREESEIGCLLDGKSMRVGEKRIATLICYYVNKDKTPFQEELFRYFAARFGSFIERTYENHGDHEYFFIYLIRHLNTDPKSLEKRAESLGIPINKGFVTMVYHPLNLFSANIWPLSQEIRTALPGSIIFRYFDSIVSGFFSNTRMTSASPCRPACATC